MILGALLDVGLPMEAWRHELAHLGLQGYTIDVKKTQQHHLHAIDILITSTEPQPQRSFKDIKLLLKKSTLNTKVKNQSLKIFHALAAAEARIHGCSLDDVHFHEVGALDSIIDIVGAVIGFHHLAITELYCSPLPLGTGFISCQHGRIPVPAPATLELLRGVPVYQTNRKQELVTPTAAAILSTMVKKFGEMPALSPLKIGYGAGKTQSDYPAVVRLILGEKAIIKKRSL